MQHAKSRGCLPEKALLLFKTEQGGTTWLGRHTESHKNGHKKVTFRRQLPVAARSKVARAAALSVALDMRLLSFCDGQPGMHEFTRTIFEMG